MKTITAEKEAGLLDTALKAVIIYDDISHAARAAAMLERVATRADENVKWDVKSWRLDALKHPSLAAVTVAVGADADLIVLAFGETHSPPEELLDWLERWSANRQIENAAIALLGPEADTAMPLRSELERFTRRRGLVFLGAHELWNGEISESILHPHPHEGPLSFAEPAPAPVHWGIND